jgi:hypothetical protein
MLLSKFDEDLATGPFLFLFAMLAVFAGLAAHF